MFEGTLPFEPEALPNGFRCERVFAAMQSIPREAFVPDRFLPQARRNVALPIGHGQTISQPLIVAYMSAALAVRPGDRILEIGSGSGYQAAILAELGAEVFSVEIIPELSRSAQVAVARVGHTGRVHFRVGDGWHGWPGKAPFDGIACTASPRHVPPALLEQLTDGRRLAIPVGPRESQKLHVLEKRASELREVGQLAVRFVPLVRAQPEA